MGLEVRLTLIGLHLSQSKYVLDLLKRTKMIDCKPCSTPIADRAKLPNQDGTLLSDLSKFHHLLGSLQYLTLTRPDVAYAVNHISQFMSCLTLIHLLAAKHIIQYVKGSLEHGIYF